MTAPKAAKPRAKAAKPAAQQPEIRAVPVEDINVDQRAQSRAALDIDAVADYAEAMRQGAQFPPLVVFHDGAEAFWLAEGFHHHRAAQEAGLEAFPCEVRSGGLREAILHSVGSNATHGVRRSNEDKRRAVLLLLEDEEWRGWSDNAIAKACAVSQPFVTKHRAAHLQTFEDGPRTVARGGNVYVMDTAAIGRKPAEAPSEPSAPPAEAPPQAPAQVISFQERRERDAIPLAEAEAQADAEAGAYGLGTGDYDPTNAIHAAEAFFGAIINAANVEVSPSAARALFARETDGVRQLNRSRLENVHAKIGAILKDFY